MKRILIMGLPGSGKTTLATKLMNELPDCTWLNADTVRNQYDDWDFSIEGRIRQAERMKFLSNACDAEYVICDFVAPLEKMRVIFDADITIWMDTIKSSRFLDTNGIFENPYKYDIRLSDFDYSIKELLNIINK